MRIKQFKKGKDLRIEGAGGRLFEASLLPWDLREMD